ncbi:lantibiotic biosynthesis dehydratase-like protein [Saccharothrix carnea]|uniref:Lantibiotic biosynthesis dehydratase-like protein n=1 Tax=Saccharothrix carnea TaxID=1280637 RepID=A0A2P8IBU1_SACCR|nr:lantibiotic dehydratase [Saccharothrix carnea]PSL55931.1 lantibiotic biosynthesis dehydratase-like protein [Saccharothrix carnea]
MTSRPLFHCADVAVLRAPVHPAALAAGLPAADDAPAAGVRLLAADPLVREAISVSSPTLPHRLDTLLDGAPNGPAPSGSTPNDATPDSPAPSRATPHHAALGGATPDGSAPSGSASGGAMPSGAAPGGAMPSTADLRRAVRALTSYRLRMATRATPFGLMAGVATDVSRELVAVRDDLARYAALPLGQGRAALTAVCERMRALAPGDRPVQVDLALDADVVLPRAVADEAERVAELLWRLSPRQPATASLRQYHNDFLERYGQGRLVGLRELPDPDIGLGAPAGCRMPPTPRFRRPEPEQDGDRDRVLAGLAQEAVPAGEPEVVLTDDHPLLTAPARHAVRPRLTVRPRAATGRHLPGGEWLYASVYSSAKRQDELLRTVPALVEGRAVDRWFFLRYGIPTTTSGCGSTARPPPSPRTSCRG